MIKENPYRLIVFKALALFPGRIWINVLNILSKHIKRNAIFNRKKFIKFCLLTFLAFLVGCDTEKGISTDRKNANGSKLEKESLSPDKFSQDDLTEAKYYRKLDAKKTECKLCFHHCIITDGSTGVCLARANFGGTLYTLTYGKPVAVYVDPLEKAPFFHVLPGSDALSLGTASCNLRCKNCINWQFAFKAPKDVDSVSMKPEAVVETSLKRSINAICFTYNEPTVQYEYLYDIASLAKAEGMTVTLHSNGMISPEPLEALLPLIDAAVVDLKSFNKQTYRDLTGGELAPVLQTLKSIRQKSWLEIVCLLIPTINDSLEEIEEMCSWIVENLGQDVPIHFSRFFPAAQLTQLPPTPVALLEQACALANNKGLDFIYINNVPGHDRTHTFCPNCREKIIHRRGLFIQENLISDNQCAFCGHKIAGTWHYN